MTEKYNEWKTSKTHAVRAELASQGYFPEHFINDETTYVRRAIVRKHPEYYAQLLTNPNNDKWVVKDIMSEVFHEPNLTNETIDVATNMIKEKPALFNMGLTGMSIYTKLLERKRIANNKEVSVLEASMSPAQYLQRKTTSGAKPIQSQKSNVSTTYEVSNTTILKNLNHYFNAKTLMTIRIWSINPTVQYSSTRRRKGTK